MTDAIAHDIADNPRLLPQSSAGWVALAVLAAAMAVLPLFVPSYYVDLGTTAMIAAMLALSMQLLVGATGLVSLGHGAFYGLAAYTVYLISPENAAQPIWITLPVAMLVAGLAAMVYEPVWNQGVMRSIGGRLRGLLDFTSPFSKLALKVVCELP